MTDLGSAEDEGLLGVAHPVLRPGLCSVTYRNLNTAAVGELARQAHLHAVEWGTDIHVPLGDVAAQERIKAIAAADGPAVAALGTYFRADPSSPPEEIPAIVAAAHRTGAPRVRVWAGDRSPADATDRYRSHVADKVRELADLASITNPELTVGLELHDGTLTDTEQAALRFLDEVDRPNVGSYWQPRIGVDATEAVAGLRLIDDQVVAVHAFSWWPSYERHTLSARPTLWRQAFEHLSSQGRPLDVLIEFVPDDNPTILAREATALRTLLRDSS
ncbi:TIM barrel protein [Microbacterium sp. KSW4-11]|uniref:TIM barrel protein n=1 Tax=Microbacterium gawkjiense TaxID=3067309 RepID=A0ABU3GF39_9MICO|nr:TIM barrel protein [Microbacterium sp. KSW4-11]MDT3318076.1 TIM barrel protein [Microbacterium sp. KSW4-11]